MKKIIPILFFCFSTKISSSKILQDSTTILKPVMVDAYLSKQPLLSTPSSVIAINKSYLADRNTTTLLPSLNSVSGIKMEERSPGSYRLSIRGSLLRSPFGIRNIKVYYNNFALTDAGGNTYLNLIDQNSIQYLEILKGPDGSLFGNNSGGVILLNTLNDKNDFSVGLNFGSYGLFSENINIQKKYKNYSFSFNQAYQKSDGYRENSAMDRFFLQTNHLWQYSKKANFNFSAFYSNLDYQTPGGLTFSQLQENPKLARANAKEQQVGIKNKSVFVGIAHEQKIAKSFKHVINLSGIITDFSNPFFTNYELRDEKYYTLRTYLEYQSKQKTFFNYQWNLGLEFQNGNSRIINYDNNKGETGNLQAADKISNQTNFIFNRFAFSLGKRFKSELSVSVNNAHIKYQSLPQSVSFITGTKKFDASLMPRFSTSYLITNNLAVRTVISKGYSLPTTAEVRANDAKINPNLNPELGWNYESGIRINNKKQSFYLGFSAFYYKMENAIVQRNNTNGENYFVNAGGTNQKGIETQFYTLLYQSDIKFIKKIDWNTAVTFSDFTFSNYVYGNNNFSGNLLTGVPKWNFSNSLKLAFSTKTSLFIQHIYNSKTSLNDAETIFAKKYNLVTTKFNWDTQVQKHKISLNFGIDNLLNENYSLGNDINAFGNRYYNPAAKRNFWTGLKVGL